MERSYLFFLAPLLLARTMYPIIEENFDSTDFTSSQSLVYADKPQTLDHFEDNIRRVIADIWPQMLEKVIENWTSRLDYIRASRGSTMPEIIFRISVGNYIHRIQENEAREKIWEAPLHSPVLMGLPGQVFSAVFRTLTGSWFSSLTPTPNWRERHSRLASVSLWRGYEFCLPAVCAFLANTGFNFFFSSDNFIIKAGLYWAARRELAYMAHSLV
ncbi:hypothetical protein TNCV_742981 [Trichonephila clavipes]|nr:hypothetical protein TNCV_742981 [Trichonephila clavipes]